MFPAARQGTLPSRSCQQHKNTNNYIAAQSLTACSHVGSSGVDDSSHSCSRASVSSSSSDGGGSAEGARGGVDPWYRYVGVTGAVDICSVVGVDQVEGQVS